MVSTFALAVVLFSSGASAQDTVSLSGQSYQLQQHPRVLLDGPSGTFTSSLKDASSSGKANPNNPAYEALVQEVDAAKKTYRNANAGAGSANNYMQVYNDAALRWVADGDPESLQIAIWGVDHVEQVTVQDTFHCNEQQSECAPYFNATDLSSLSNSLAQFAQTYSIVHDHLTAAERRSFADKILNDNAVSENGVGRSATELDARCANWQASGAWGDGEGYCGLVWLLKHDRYAPEMATGQESHFAADYPAAGGRLDVAPHAASATLQQLHGYIAIGLALASDDSRARTLLEQSYNYYFRWFWPYAKSGWTGMTQGGNAYTSTVDLPLATEIAMMIQHSVISGPDLVSGTYLERALAYEPYLYIPGGQGLMAAWGDTQAASSQVGADDVGILPALALYPNDSLTPFAYFWLRDVAGHFGVNDLLGYNGGSTIHSAFEFYDPAAPDAEISGLPSQFLFGSTDYSQCVEALTSQGCFAGTALQNAVSKSDWSNGATDVMIQSGYNSANYDGSGDGSNFGSYHIYKNGYLLAGDGVTRTSDNGSGRLGQETTIELGGANHFLAQGAATISRWAGDAQGRFAYALADASAAYDASAGALRVQRHIIHFKGPDTQDFIVSYDDIATQGSSLKKAYWHYALNGLPSSAVSVDPSSLTVTNTQSGGKLMTQFVAVGGPRSVVLGSDSGDGSYAGGNGFTYRAYVCASRDGATCDAAATSGEWIAVHEPVTNTGAAMEPATSLSTIDGDWRGVQIAGSSPKVAIFARGGGTYAQTSFTTDYSGTAQILVAGLSVGTYSVTRDGVTILNAQPVVNGNNTLYFESPSGSFAVQQANSVSASSASGDTGGSTPVSTSQARRTPALQVNGTLQTSGTVVYLPAPGTPIGSITISSCTNATPIVCTTTAPHGLSSGAAIWIQGITGLTNANGFFNVGNVTSNTFSLANYLYFSNVPAGNGSYGGSGQVTVLTGFSLTAHPRVMLDGPSGTIESTVASGGRKATSSNPFYQSLQSDLSAFSSQYTNAGVDSEGGSATGCGGGGCGMGRYALEGLNWLASGNATALTIAEYGIDNIQQVVAGPYGFYCNESGSQCGRDDTTVMLHANEDIASSFQSYSIVRSQLSASEISNFADKILNDNAMFVNGNSTRGNGIGGIRGDITTSCTPWPSGAAWSQSANYCGALWMWKHECFLTTMNPGQETRYQNDYPGGAGCEFGQEWPYDSNHTVAHQRAAIAAGIALADDDPRAQMLLTQVISFFYKWQYAHALSSWTGMTENGARYQQYVDSDWSPEIVSMLKNSLGYDISGGNWIQKYLPQELYGVLPDGSAGTGNTPLGLDTWLDSSGTNCCTGDPREWATPALDEIGLFPSDAIAPYLYYTLRNVSGFSSMTWNALQNDLFYQYIYYDPSATATNPNGSAPTQYLFRDTDYATCQAIYGSTTASHNFSSGNPGIDTAGCYPNWAYEFGMSRSAWSTTATQLVFAAPYGSDLEDRSGCGQYGVYHIYRNGYLLAGDGSGAVGPGYATGSAHGGGGTCSNEVAGDEVIEVGGGDNWVSMHTNSPAISNFDRWGGTDPTGDSQNRYAYVMTNLTGTYVPTVGVTRAARHVIHFKKSGTQDYIVSYDDVALSKGEEVQAWWHYFTQNAHGTNTVSTNTSARTASNTLAGGGAKLLSSFLPVSGSTIAYISNGASNNTFKTYTCASADGSTCSSAATSFEEVAVHLPTTTTSATMPTISQPACVGIGGNCTVVDIQDSTYPKVAAIARQGALLTSMTFISTHAGTAQYVIAGLAAGTYNVSVTGTTVASGVAVNAGDNTLYFESTSGVVTVSQGAPLPDFLLTAIPGSQTITVGGLTTYTTTVGALAGFSGTVTLTASGLPTGATASFLPPSINTLGTSILTVTTTGGTAAGTYTVTITGTSGSTQHTTTVSLVLNAVAQPDFSLSATPSSQTVTAGSSTTYTATVGALSGFAGTVTLAASGLPSGATPGFSPASISTSGTSTLTVTTTSGTAAGTYTVTITGTSGSTQHTTTVSLVVNGSGGGGGTGPAIATFIASPSSMPSGDSGTLSWTTTGATSIAITPGTFTSTSASGSTTVSPTATTTYTLTATNSGGTSTATATVNMAQNGSACSVMSAGVGASLNGFVPFPASNPWNQNISALPVDPNSAAIIGYIGTTVPLHPDFSSTGGGIPYIVVDSSTTPLVNISLSDASESDLMPMPFTSNAPIETGTDHHVLVVDRNTCWLYEMWEGALNGSAWSANNSAVWDLSNYNDRPFTWTSADAAGLAVFPGLVRYDEVAAGAINHAFRFTVPDTFGAYVAPATHWAPTDNNSPIPMGVRIRLKASFDISGYSAENQVILTAMKTYGMIMADNGSSMYVTGAPDSRWNDSDLHNLSNLTASDFEVVTMPTEISNSNVPTGTAPVIHAFTSSASTVTSGTAVTLSWNEANGSYQYINPSAGTQVGMVRGTSVVVNPTVTTTYKLYDTNDYGRATANVTVTVNNGTPDFSISATPNSQTVTAGGSTTYSATVAALSGFTGTVALTASGLPSGATPSFSPASITTSGSSTLTVTTASTTAAGTYTVTITGTSGSTQHTTAVTIVVNAPVQPNFSLSATPNSRTVTAGGSTTYTATVGALAGFTGTVTLTASGLPSGATPSFSPASITTSGSSTLTVTTTGSTAAGTYTVTVTGNSGSTQHTATVTLVVNAAASPDFSLATTPSSQTVTAGGSTTYTATVGALAGFTGTVALTASGLPSGATASFSPASITTSGTSTLTVTTTSSTPAGTSTLTITGTSGSTQHTANTTLVVNAASQPDFSISATPNTQTVTAGGSTSYTTTIGALSGFTGTVALTASGLPSGATASFSPASITTSGTSTLTVTTTSSTAAGTYTVTLTGTSGSTVHGSSISLVVNVPQTIALSSTTSSAQITAGGSATFTINVTSTGGFSGVVSLTTSGQPSGVTASYSPTSVTGSGTTLLTLSSQSSVTAGTYTISAKGTSGSLTSTVALSLTITAPSSNVTVSTNPTSATVGSGGSTQFAVTMAGSSTLSSPAFTCAGLPSYATCQFTAPALAGNGLSASSTLTLTISGQSSDVQKRNGLMTAVLVGSTTFGFIGLVFAGMGDRRRRAAGLLIAGAVMCLAFGGCVGYSGTPNSETNNGGSGSGPQNFSFSVNGSAQESGATVTNTATVSVTVN